MGADHEGTKESDYSAPRAGGKPKEIHTTVRYYGGDRNVPLEPTIIGGPKPSLIRVLMHTNRVSQVGQKGTLGPIYNVHVDQSASAAVPLAHRWLGDEAEELLAKPRFQIINMWRPCKPITRDPFAVTDANTVAESDYIKVPFIYPDRTGACGVIG
ncbi:hypothetical protein CH063_11829 [Colletotrichum higginsianum]|uniref:Uncharacterized protein n=1 Tax=Colletotrichum higginsianum (strain IMI 349063) TaxID=759273 RepID=H1VMY9_COLHI|nr:hypothetical protein CH063_11829 [Colletotrichum higginsianum]